MNHLDLFSGYGGFTISAQKQGWDTVNFSEIDKYATAVLKYRFPDIKNLGDITKIKPEDLPVVDIITGGSPCQDLSVAGKGAGLDGARSGLFFHFIRLIKEKQPMYFVWENVKGALSSSKGWDFARVQIEMEQAGYDVFWQVINAKDFGVPQNRERIFAIGIRKGSGREILFEQRESRQNTNKIVDTGYKGIQHNQGEPAVAIPNSNGNIHSLDANYWKGSNNPNKSRRSQVAEVKAIKYGQNNPDRNGNTSEEMFTLKSGDSHAGVLQDMRIRRLTPTECEKLMGLEPGWTAKGIIDGKEVDISDTQRYKLCGNGVVVNCVDYIYNLIIKSYERRCKQGVYLHDQ